MPLLPLPPLTHPHHHHRCRFHPLPLPPQLERVNLPSAKSRPLSRSPPLPTNDNSPQGVRPAPPIRVPLPIPSSTPPRDRDRHRSKTTILLLLHRAAILLLLLLLPSIPPALTRTLPPPRLLSTIPASPSTLCSRSNSRSRSIRRVHPHPNTLRPWGVAAGMGLSLLRRTLMPRRCRPPPRLCPHTLRCSRRSSSRITQQGRHRRTGRPRPRLLRAEKARVCGSASRRTSARRSA